MTLALAYQIFESTWIGQSPDQSAKALVPLEQTKYPGIRRTSGSKLKGVIFTESVFCFALLSIHIVKGETLVIFIRSVKFFEENTYYSNTNSSSFIASDK